MSKIVSADDQGKNEVNDNKAMCSRLVMSISSECMLVNEGNNMNIIADD